MISTATFTPVTPDISFWSLTSVHVGLVLIGVALLVFATGYLYDREDWLRAFFDHFCMPLFVGAFLMFVSGVFAFLIAATDDMDNAVNDSYTAQFIDHLKSVENVKTAKGFIRGRGPSKYDKPGSNQFIVTYTDGTSGLIQYTYDDGDISYVTLTTVKD
ncbi:hypothetical protein [Aeromicrobium sp. 179-A 4D2 NHS]|uniref:hypothetical protein n=1 Tax=Aeromicrobium sp. 179-A 4D2 NHS TaxID=3142375 RepID=UPI0039A1ACAD